MGAAIRFAKKKTGLRCYTRPVKGDRLIRLRESQKGWPALPSREPRVQCGPGDLSTYIFASLVRLSIAVFQNWKG